MTRLDEILARREDEAYDHHEESPTCAACRGGVALGPDQREDWTQGIDVCNHCAQDERVFLLAEVERQSEAERERAAVVAWLRDMQDYADRGLRVSAVALAFRLAADAFECGEHRITEATAPSTSG